jgi:broad-specificity NMP kinase
MAIIAISGSVGSGKTTFAKALAKELNYEVLHLNEVAKKYKLEDIKELQTFDFDLDDLLDDFEKELKENKYKNIVIESHFSHLINPELIDVLFVVNRDLKLLKEEYKIRKYNDQKIQDNLEVESFNLCFYEAEEAGYFVGNEKIGALSNENEKEEHIARVFSFDNNAELQNLLPKAKKKLEKYEIIGDDK